MLKTHRNRLLITVATCVGFWSWLLSTARSQGRIAIVGRCGGQPETGYDDETDEPG
jgi:hypothetical protein